MKRIVIIKVFYLVVLMLLLGPLGNVEATSYLPPNLSYTEVFIAVDWWNGTEEANIDAAWYLFSQDYPNITDNAYLEVFLNDVYNDGFELLVVAVEESDLPVLNNPGSSFTTTLQSIINIAQPLGLEIFVTVEDVDPQGTGNRTTRETKELLIDSSSSFNSNNQQSDEDIDGLITSDEFIKLDDSIAFGWQPSGNNDAALQPATSPPGGENRSGCSLMAMARTYPPVNSKQTIGYFILLVPLFIAMLLFPII